MPRFHTSHGRVACRVRSASNRLSLLGIKL
jgi:hypothetical protein